VVADQGGVAGQVLLDPGILACFETQFQIDMYQFDQEAVAQAIAGR
jgi:hypothetical protein